MHRFTIIVEFVKNVVKYWYTAKLLEKFSIPFSILFIYNTPSKALIIMIVRQNPAILNIKNIYIHTFYLYDIYVYIYI